MVKLASTTYIVCGNPFEKKHYFKLNLFNLPVECHPIIFT